MIVHRFVVAVDVVRIAVVAVSTSMVIVRPSDGGIGAVVGVGGVCGCVVVVGVGHGMRRSGAPAASRSHAESLSGIGVGVAPDRAVVEVKDLG
ncbi:hypothetical protein EDB84DRAFT_1548709 [Lactarius hengduanensis]|nr:hypothetical protein EDB84DRAFT_1548709 [Lactarius hengduanensis]